MDVSTDIPLAGVEWIDPERCHHYLMDEDTLIALLRTAREKHPEMIMLDVWETAEVVDLDITTPESTMEVFGEYPITIYVQDWQEEEAS